MARSIINAKIASVIARRGNASASQGGVKVTVKGSVVGMMKQKAWIPDPVTGYYKPEGHENQIDPAELREMLLKQQTRRN